MIQNNRIILFICLNVLPHISANSQDAEGIFQRGNSLFSQGKFKEALIYVDSSLNIDSSLYQRYFFRAQIKFNLGMPESAINDLSRCIDKCNCPTRNHHVSDYYLKRGELQFYLKNQSKSMADINQSLSYNPKNWEAYNFRSLLFIGRGQIQLALADLDKSYLINDNEATTLIARGKLRIEIGDIEGACVDLSKVVDWGFDEFEPWLSNNCRK